ncbi:MAG: glycosyltransferase family 39 protein [Candidatus Omnitrophota bacterium]|nr:glycosyltransferase family 39 protein [Candidatus Omnitrophota bacterium]
MFKKTKQILQNSFYQLLAVYALLILAVSLGLFWKYSLQFQIFALIIALFGISIIPKESKEESNKLNKNLHYFLFILAILLIFILRAIPYINNTIPLGYDAGIYKYGIESGLKNLDKWILQGGHEPGFLYLMQFFKIFFSIGFILKWLLIGFCILLGSGVYFVVKEFSNKQTGLIALFIYAFSLIQFKAFWYMYYRNVIGMSLVLFSIYFLKKYENTNKTKYLWFFAALGGLLGGIHRPSFYIFGLSYFIYAFISPYKNKRYDFKQLGENIAYGLLIIAIAGLFYLGKFSQAITVMFEPVLQGFIQPGESAGTFINFFTFQFSSLFYLPFALLGLFCFIRKRQFNFLVIWAIINFIIVYFQFFFFNRFIIFLDLVLIILASFGFSLLIENKKKLGILILVVLLLSAGILTFKEARDSKPLISEQELKIISYLNTTEENALVMATSSYYSPWVLGYSGRKTIAPGLFDYNKHNKGQWATFWTASNLTEIKAFLDAYEKPLYIFIGKRQEDNLAQFGNTECFRLYSQEENNKIYEYSCQS